MFGHCTYLIKKDRLQQNELQPHNDLLWIERFFKPVCSDLLIDILVFRLRQNFSPIDGWILHA